jgi:hypothetical protein
LRRRRAGLLADEAAVGRGSVPTKEESPEQAQKQNKEEAKKPSCLQTREGSQRERGAHPQPHRKDQADWQAVAALSPAER